MKRKEEIVSRWILRSVLMFVLVIFAYVIVAQQGFMGVQLGPDYQYEQGSYPSTQPSSTQPSTYSGSGSSYAGYTAKFKCRFIPATTTNTHGIEIYDPAFAGGRTLVTAYDHCVYERSGVRYDCDPTKTYAAGSAALALLHEDIRLEFGCAQTQQCALLGGANNLIQSVDCI
ncbi:MAG TPA: hypothetical protein VJK51_01705 [Candidatus Nanoarchaeia archaeon]|nr:hypothetical protein [Candidatus Nanoarchaeia archaeon]